MRSLLINAQNFKTVNLNEQYFKFCEFADISTDGGHVDSDFANCTFKNIDWYWGLFNYANFIDCIFINCTFRGTSFSSCKFVACEFNDCRFISDNLGGECSFDNSVEYSCKLTKSVGFAARPQCKKWFDRDECPEIMRK